MLPNTISICHMICLPYDRRCPVVHMSIVTIVNLSRKSLEPGDLGLGGRVREQTVEHLPSSRFSYESSDRKHPPFDPA